MWARLKIRRGSKFGQDASLTHGIIASPTHVGRAQCKRNVVLLALNQHGAKTFQGLDLNKKIIFNDS